jgi:hypothetical protein
VITRRRRSAAGNENDKIEIKVFKSKCMIKNPRKLKGI